MIVYTNTDDLSKAVSELVMGECYPRECFQCGSGNVRITRGHCRITLFCEDCGRTNAAIPSYATDVNEALAVLQRLRDSVDVEKGDYPEGITIHVPLFNPRMRGSSLEWPWKVEMSWSGDFEGPTLCVAICLAALNSIGHKCAYETNAEITYMKESAAK